MITKSNLKIILSVILVGFLVAVVYIIFEAVVAGAINTVWLDLFKTTTNRILVIPLSFCFGLIYFKVKNDLNKKEKSQKTKSIIKLLIVLGVGFLSLFAGASLGPEAILIPSALIIGLGISKTTKQSKYSKILGLAGFVALFVAFFNSILAGFLGLYLANKQSSQKFSLFEYALMLISSTASYVTLAAFSHKGSFAFPPHQTTVSIVSVLLLVIFFIAGYCSHWLLVKMMELTDLFKNKIPSNMINNGIIASLGLSLIFIIGGPFVQFTGNEFIRPLFLQASQIGVIGLLWICFIKIFAIAWSIKMGYRGGLVFPLVLVASSIVAIATLYTYNFDLVLSILIFLVGALFADRKDNVIVGGTTHE